MNDKEINKQVCHFEQNKVCCALACFSNQSCNARDTNGNPIYASLSAIKVFKALKDKE